MSKDIRSFFKLSQKKNPSASAASSEKHSPSKSKRKATKIVSSDEDEKVSKSDNKKKRRIIDSDEEESEKMKQKSNVKSTKKLVEVDVFKMFGADPVKRIERPKVKTPKTESQTIKEDTSVMDVSIDVDAIEEKSSPKKVSPPKPRTTEETNPKKSPHKSDNHKSDSSRNKSKQDLKVEVKKEENKTPAKAIKRSSSPRKKETEIKPDLSKTMSPIPKKARVSTSASSSAKKEKKVVAKKEPMDLNQSVLSDEERQERKMHAIAIFHQFKNRATVINHGCKEIPKFKPKCLEGNTFLVSGVLESMERDEANELIKKCGGKVVTTVTKKLNYLVIGEEVGPAKIAKAEELKITQISEDDLLNLIRKKSGLPTISTVDLNKDKIPGKDSPGKENRLANKEEDVKKQSKTSDKPKDEVSTKVSPKAVTKAVTIVPRNLNDLSFVDKYKPTELKQIIGQQTPSSNSNKLLNWLSKWYSNHDGKKKLTKPSPWAKNDDGGYFKCALLSGPPGVGKTTTATLVCQELSFDTVEFNASDTRSKKLLKEEVASILSNKSLNGYFSGTETKVSKRFCLIMDEVDGMAGNEDRGGIAELIGLIKDSHIPIICMCNDRNHQKMRSLVNHCYDLRFTKPPVQQIKGAMMSICFKEGIKMEPGAIDEIINGTGNDIRQTLNHLAMYSASKDAGKLDVDAAKRGASSAAKDIKIGPWEVVRKVFSAEEHKKMNIHDKCDLFFNDYSMGPLFVQENYLKVQPKGNKDETMKKIAMAADSLSLGDMVEKRIRSNMAWSLLPTQAVFSSVLPGEYMSGNFTGQINFPHWLGKNSTVSKRRRLAQEINDHTRLSTSGSRMSVRLDYAPFLARAIIQPLVDKGSDGVADSLAVIKEYRLLREDIDSLLELSTWPKTTNLWSKVESKVKAALTRAYNKDVQPYSYSVAAGFKKKKSSDTNDDVEGYGDDEDNTQETSDEEDESLENNAFVKVKKSTATKDVKSESKSDKKDTAGSSKAGGSGTSKSSSSKSKGIHLWKFL